MNKFWKIFKSVSLDLLIKSFCLQDYKRLIFQLSHRLNQSLQLKTMIFEVIVYVASIGSRRFVANNKKLSMSQWTKNVVRTKTSPHVTWQHCLNKVEWNISKFWRLLVSLPTTLAADCLWNSKYQFGWWNSKRSWFWGVALQAMPHITALFHFFLDSVL